MTDEELERERLHQAAADGDLTLVQELIQGGYDVNAIDGDLRYTPLHYAAEGGHLDVVQCLIGAGANVNAIDDASAGDTPLGHVPQTCSLDLAKILLDAGANPLIPGTMQITPLMRAGRRKKPEGKALHDLMLRHAKSRYHYHNSE